MKRAKLNPAPIVDDPPLTIAEVAARWKRNPDVALRMLKRANVPLVRLTNKTVMVKLSRILELEAQAELSLPHGFKKDFPGRVERQAARKAEKAAK